MAKRTQRIPTYIHYVKIAAGVRRGLLIAAKSQFEKAGSPDEDYTHPYMLLNECKNWINFRTETELRRMIDLLQNDGHWYLRGRSYTAMRSMQKGMRDALKEFEAKRETGEPMKLTGYVYRPEQSAADEAEAALLSMASE